MSESGRLVAPSWVAESMRAACELPSSSAAPGPTRPPASRVRIEKCTGEEVPYVDLRLGTPPTPGTAAAWGLLLQDLCGWEGQGRGLGATLSRSVRMELRAGAEEEGPNSGAGWKHGKAAGVAPSIAGHASLAASRSPFPQQEVILRLWAVQPEAGGQEGLRRVALALCAFLDAHARGLKCCLNARMRSHMSGLRDEVALAKKGSGRRRGA